MTIFTPLDQFTVFTYFENTLFGLNINFTNSSAFMLLGFICITIILYVIFRDARLIPSRGQVFGLAIYDFLLELVTDNIGPKGLKYFPFVFTLFMFVVICNLLGMIPYSFTVTSHIVVTFGLSLSILLAVTIIGFINHGIHFFSLFLPAGSPIAMAPLLVVIELVSYVSRAFSLGIRLFANMMSGHSLLKILAGFSWSMLSIGGIFYILQLLPLVAVFLITGLEIGIAVIQAYVFSILTCVYLNDAINLH